MFDNMGGKIKSLAKIICIIGIVTSLVAGMIFMVIMTLESPGDELTVAGFFGGILISGIGFLLSWIGSFFMCGFGELIQSSSETAKYTKAIYESMNGEEALNLDETQPEDKEPAEATPTYYDEPALEDWVCEYCGTANAQKNKFCKQCGIKRES